MSNDVKHLSGLELLKHNDIIYNNDYVTSTFYYSSTVRELNEALNVTSKGHCVLYRKCINISPNHTENFEMETYPQCDTHIDLLPLDNALQLCYEKGQESQVLPKMKINTHDKLDFTIHNPLFTSQRCIVCVNVRKNNKPNLMYHSPVDTSISPFRIKRPLSIHLGIRMETTTYYPKNVRIFVDKHLRKHTEVVMLMNYPPLMKCVANCIESSMYIVYLYDEASWKLLSDELTLTTIKYFFVLCGTGVLHKDGKVSSMQPHQEILLRVTSPCEIQCAEGMWLFCVHFKLPCSFTI